MYSIAYTAQGDDCYASLGANVNGTVVTQFRSTLESPDPGALQALDDISSPGPQYFYDVPNPSSLTVIFQRIAADIAGGTSRIVQ